MKEVCLISCCMRRSLCASGAERRRASPPSCRECKFSLSGHLGIKTASLGCNLCDTVPNVGPSRTHRHALLFTVTIDEGAESF
uniref:Uncharacterized protein n=1 Tax=Anguilla anguilla TaxID=7936 RepID=A0A0E9QIG8_ANGAN